MGRRRSRRGGSLCRGGRRRGGIHWKSPRRRPSSKERAMRTPSTSISRRGTFTKSATAPTLTQRSLTALTASSCIVRFVAGGGAARTALRALSGAASQSAPPDEYARFRVRKATAICVLVGVRAQAVGEDDFKDCKDRNEGGDCEVGEETEDRREQCPRIFRVGGRSG